LITEEKDLLEGHTKDALKGLSADAMARLRAAMDRVRLGTSNLLNASIFTTPQVRLLDNVIPTGLILINDIGGVLPMQELLNNAQMIDKAVTDTELSAPKIKSNPTEVMKNTGAVISAVR